MIVLEMKAVLKPSQCSAIDEAIRTVQFIRNKALRLWMDAKREGIVNFFLRTNQLLKMFLIIVFTMKVFRQNILGNVKIYRGI